MSIKAVQGNDGAWREAKFEDVRACKGTMNVFSVHKTGLGSGCGQVINRQCR